MYELFATIVLVLARLLGDGARPHTYKHHSRREKVLVLFVITARISFRLIFNGPAAGFRIIMLHTSHRSVGQNWCSTSAIAGWARSAPCLECRRVLLNSTAKLGFDPPKVRTGKGLAAWQSVYIIASIHNYIHPLQASAWV